jgi:sugar phosphate isomerase/epimerase
MSSLSHKLKIGLQTISWGSSIDDLDALCGMAARLGFEGLEIAQKMSTVAQSDIADFHDVLTQQGLHLAGLAGGSLHSRLAIREHVRPEYYYIDEWDTEAIEAAFALDPAIQIGFHPHVYKEVDTIAAAREHLSAFPNVGLILDTAHLTLVGEDVLDIFQEYRSRVIAVHLKDWTSQYGSSPFSLGQGFTALGEGDLDNWNPATLARVLSKAEKERKRILSDMVAYMLQTEFRGWVIIEQDTAHGDPCDAAFRSMTWLHKAIGQSQMVLGASNHSNNIPLADASAV